MFDSVRQIIETRFFASKYTTVSGDSLGSIASTTGVSVDRINDLNPTFVDFPRSVRVTFNNNGIGAFNRSDVSGFADGFLVPTNTSRNVLRFANEFSNPGAVNTSAGANVIISISDNNLSLSEKITEWTSLINNESTLGFTAVASGSSITLTSKDNSENLFPEGSISVSAINTFQVSTSLTVDAGIVLSIGAGLDFTIFIEGRQFTQPTNSKFAILMIQDATSVAREFGNVKDGRRRSGSVRVKLYVPHGKGTKEVRDMADALDNILAYSTGDNNTGNGGNLFMKTGSLRQVSENTDGFLEYNLDYIYDYYTS